MIRTGGGRFDPAAAPAFFLAGGQYLTYMGVHGYNLVATNDIASDEQRDELGAYLESEPGLTNNVLLDSGVFWLTQRHMRAHPGLSMNDALALPPGQIDGFDWLYETYLKCVARLEPSLWGYIELDQGGAANKRVTRARLEAEGLRPIPVYHPLNDGWDYFDELAENYDRICVGNVVQASQPARKHILATVWERRRRYPGLWIHVLGLTPNEITSVYPQASCDSSSWVYAIRFGAQGAPGATAMSKVFGKHDSTFTYVPSGRALEGDEGHEDAGHERANEWLAAEHHFQHRAMRRHFADQEALFGESLWPPANDLEGVRR